MKPADRVLAYVVVVLLAAFGLTGLVLHHANVADRWDHQRQNTKVSCGNGGATYEFDWRIRPGSITCPPVRYDLP